MNITRDVVIDLLPVYESGEASADTRALVDAFLARDEEFARIVRAARRSNPVLPPALEPGADVERTALNETLRALRKKRWTHALALFCTLVPFTFTFSGTNLTFFMLRDRPEAVAFLVPAAALWWSYFRQSHLFRRAGWPR
jgi:hypothetical protein